MKSRLGLNLLKNFTKSIYSLEHFQLPEGPFLKTIDAKTLMVSMWVANEECKYPTRRISISDSDCG